MKVMKIGSLREKEGFKGAQSHVLSYFGGVQNYL